MSGDGEQSGMVADWELLVFVQTHLHCLPQARSKAFTRDTRCREKTKKHCGLGGGVNRSWKGCKRCDDEASGAGERGGVGFRFSGVIGMGSECSPTSVVNYNTAWVSEPVQFVAVGRHLIQHMTFIFENHPLRMIVIWGETAARQHALFLACLCEPSWLSSGSHLNCENCGDDIR